jgi:hypothetical protein
MVHDGFFDGRRCRCQWVPRWYNTIVMGDGGDRDGKNGGK